MFSNLVPRVFFPPPSQGAGKDPGNEVGCLGIVEINSLSERISKIYGNRKI